MTKGGAVDPDFVSSYKAARAAGITNIDAYMFACTFLLSLLGMITSTNKNRYGHATHRRRVQIALDAAERVPSRYSEQQHGSGTSLVRRGTRVRRM